MNPQDPQNAQNRWQDTNADFNQTRPFSQNFQSNSTDLFSAVFATTRSLYQQARTWLASLPKEGQLVAIGLTVVLGISAIVTVLKLVSFLLSIALVGGFAYIGYKFITANKEQ
jgi:hypothetical protein